MVNVLDVPIQGRLLFEGSRNVSSSSLESVVFTLDPQDKYLPSGIRRATTTSAVHARKAHLPATIKPKGRGRRNESIRAEIVPQTSKTTQDVLTLGRPRSLLSIFHRMRQTRSAGSIANSNLIWPRKIFSRLGQQKHQEAPETVPEMTNSPDHATDVPSPSPTRIGYSFELPIQLPSSPDDTDRAETAFMVTGSRNKVSALRQPSSSDHSQSIPLHPREQEFDDGRNLFSIKTSNTSFLSSHHTPLEHFKDTSSCFVPNSTEERNDMALSDHLGRLNLAPYTAHTITDTTKSLPDKQITIVSAAPSTESLGSVEPGFHSPKFGYPESLASNAASANFSPYLASTTTHSGPISQPETPDMSDFGDDLLPPLRDPEPHARMDEMTGSGLESLSARPASRAGPPMLSRLQGKDTQISHATFGGFQGYSLSQHDHASVLTIRKLPSLTSPNSKPDSASPFTQQQSKQDLVHSWNDGSEHHMTALGELVDDLGYLGRVII